MPSSPTKDLTLKQKKFLKEGDHVFIKVPDWETRLKAVKIITSFLSVEDKQEVRALLKTKGFSNTRIARYIAELDAALATLPKSQARKESNRKRWKILKRDKFTCQYCGRATPEVELHVDHRIPLVAGGNSDDDNLVTACADCNLGKNKYV